MSNTPGVRDMSAKTPIFIYLKNGEKEKLPSAEYVRFVAQHTSAEGKVVRADFALHKRGARLCRLLDAFLDSVDVDLKAKFDPVSGSIPPVVMPMATREGCETLFHYLDLAQTRIPTLISKPLRAPLEELVQPWEMIFLLQNCLGMPAAECAGFKTSSFLKSVAKRGPSALDRLIEITMLSDFLLIDSLCDLTAAFLASLGLSATTEKDLLQLCGLTAPLTEEELEPLYAQLGFLRPAAEA